MGTSRRDALRMGFLTAAGITGLKIVGPHAAVAAETVVAAAEGIPLDGFLKLAGIRGDSTDADHAGEIVVGGYSFGVANTGSAGGGTGGGQGKATFTDLALTTEASSASPQLLVACASGNHFPEAVLTVRRGAGEQGLEFLKVTVEDVVISGYQAAGTTADGATHETFTLNFATIKVEYTPQTATGGAGTVSSGGWDLKQNGPLAG